MRYLVLMRLPVRFNITAEFRNKREARVLCLVRLIPLSRLTITEKAHHGKSS